MKQPPVLRAALTGVCVLWAAFIFSNSLRTGPFSGAQSTAVMAQLETAGLLVPEWIIRKAGHLLEYAAYGFLLCAAVFTRRSNLRGCAAAALCIGAVTGAADETLQRFVPGRSGQAADVLIDTAGTAAGIVCFVLAAVLFHYFKYRRLQSHETDCKTN